MERHVTSADLTAAEISTLDQNWSAASEGLDLLVSLNAEHRAGGCRNWFCSTERLAHLLVHLEPHQMQMVLRVALERLAERE